MAPSSSYGFPMREREVPNIAIIDDRQGDRETVTRVMLSTLRKMSDDAKGWGVIAEAPPPEARDIVAWLDENDALVLVTDWRLNEGAEGNRLVDYEADSLIKALRSKRPTFPIYVITGFASEAKSHLKDVEGVFDRSGFSQDAHYVVPQMVRAGRKVYEENRTVLGELDAKAKLVASGTATEEDKKALASLQGFFQAELPLVINLDALLSDLEDAAKRADALRAKVSARLAKHKSQQVRKHKKS